MDDALIKLVTIGFAFLVSGFVNYAAVSMADAPPRKLRVAGIFFGAAGILLMAMVLFWPLISLLYYFTGDATGITRLFNPLLIAAIICTSASAAILAANACGVGRGG